METVEAQAAFRRRKGLVEPVLDILKEQMEARRFLLRGPKSVPLEGLEKSGGQATPFNLFLRIAKDQPTSLASHPTML